MLANLKMKDCDRLGRGLGPLGIMADPSVQKISLPNNLRKFMNI